MRDEHIPMRGIDALQKLMSSENELLRCAALQAYARQESDINKRRACLVDALMDPDPDVRADAMEALAEIATNEELPSIRHSLIGDPVREVKQGAIRTLGRIGTQADKSLLRKLVLSRCDDTVAWEDALGDWEEWLDIQVCAINALGQLGDTESIEDLLHALDDPHGQNLDAPVFDALGKMGATGISWLLAVVQTGSGLARKRAADTLAQLAPDALVDHVDTLLEDIDPALRLHAVNALSAKEERLASLASEDPDPNVRRAALRRAAVEHPDLPLKCLKDEDASVQAAALDTLSLPLNTDDAEAVIDNICVWVTCAKPMLLTATARNLARFAPERAENLLSALAHDSEKPLDARVTAVRALSTLSPPVPAKVFLSLFSNPAQQVRLAAVVALRDGYCETEVHLNLADAVTLAYLQEKDAFRQPAEEDNGPDVSAPKEGSTGQSPIRITIDGDIVDTETPPAKGSSTLSSILSDTMPMPDTEVLAEDTPEESAPKRKKRRAVEGPDEVAKSLALDILRSCAELPGEAMRTAIAVQLTSSDNELRISAWNAASVRAKTDECARKLYEKQARAVLQDGDPSIRFRAFEILDFGRADAKIRALALTTSDALSRAAAISRLPTKAAIEHIADRSEAVREAAVKALLLGPSPAEVLKAVDILSAGKFIDTLSFLLTQSEFARDRVLSDLGSGDIDHQQVYVLLRALAGDKSRSASDLNPELHFA